MFRVRILPESHNKKLLTANKWASIFARLSMTLLYPREVVPLAMTALASLKALTLVLESYLSFPFSYTNH